MKYFITILILFCAHLISSAQPIIEYSPADKEARLKKTENLQTIIPVDLPADSKFNIDESQPEQRIKEIRDNELPVFQTDVSNFYRKGDYLYLKSNKEFPSFSNQAKFTANPPIALSQTAQEALLLCPSWFKQQLVLKLEELNKYGLDDDFAQLIIDAPQKHKDEIAFIIAYTSANSLRSSRFLADINMIPRSVDFIYQVDSVLQYVDLVEFEGNENITTAKYRIYDPGTNDTIWSMIPQEIYYFYVVLPKLDQEGVYVKDNGDDASGQRTYGYDWRTFIWNNPDPAHDYTLVNKSTSKGTISTIPVFKDLITKAKILWDRNRTYFTFNRPFKDSDHALDIIGNWCSRAVPVDVTLPRCFQPNQVLMKHDGNCNEDAFLVAGACRTALIPLIYLGTWSQDHVFGSFWDSTWNHFEFFRGGLAPTGNEFYGITNMLPRGSYGWKDAMVEGYRPDGMILNFTEYYANTCQFTVTVTDTIGRPIDGARLTLFASPSVSGNSYLECGTVWTNSNGKAIFKTGESKQFLIQSWHPDYGWNPVDSTRAFRLTNNLTAKNGRYSVNVPYSHMKIPANTPTLINDTKPALYDFRVKLSSNDIITDINTRDSQKSRFYYNNGQNDGTFEFIFCDSVNFEQFNNNQPYEAYQYNANASDMDVRYPLPQDRTMYLILKHHQTATTMKNFKGSIMIYKNEGVSVPENIELPSAEVSPNPFHNVCRISTDKDLGRLSVFNQFGNKIAELNYPYIWEPDASLGQGVYFASFDGQMQKHLIKLFYVK